MDGRSSTAFIWMLMACSGASCLPRAALPTPEVREERRGSDMGYRVHLPPVLTTERARVAVWLHPEGSEGLDLVEPLAPVLAKHGFALVVPRNVDTRAWTSDQIKALFLGVLPSAVERYGLSGEQPLLIGYSAGAQMALHLWHTAPERWAGLLLVGAAPQLTSVDQVSDVTFIEAWRYANTPVLSIVGERDPSAGKWRSILDKWKQQGVQLDFKQVPNTDHAWNVGAFERERIDSWLETLALPPAAQAK